MRTLSGPGTSTATVASPSYACRPREFQRCGPPVAHLLALLVALHDGAPSYPFFSLSFFSTAAAAIARPPWVHGDVGLIFKTVPTSPLLRSPLLPKYDLFLSLC